MQLQVFLNLDRESMWKMFSSKVTIIMSHNNLVVSLMIQSVTLGILAIPNKVKFFHFLI